MATPARARVLVVCHANVTRSVLGAHLLRAAAFERGFALDTRSAGTHAPDGQAVSPRTRAAASGLELDQHRSHALTDEDVGWADLVITMEASQVRWIRARYEGAAPRTASLGFLARAFPDDRRPLVDRVVALGLGGLEPDEGDDVGDPAGGDDAAYAACVEDLAARCAALAARFAP